MKYIIILLASLFLVSNASARDEYGMLTIKEICNKQSWSIRDAKTTIEDNVILERLTIQQINDIEKDIIEYAKLYHYLDCREELGR